MELEVIILSDGSQKEKDKYDITYMWNLKSNTNELIYETETDSQTQKIDLLFPGLGGRHGEWVGIDWEFGISRCKLLYIGWIKQGPTVYSTGNYIQYPMINHNGKEYEKEYISICITKSLCNTPETNATL